MGLLIAAAIIAILTLGDYDLARRLRRAHAEVDQREELILELADENKALRDLNRIFIRQIPTPDPRTPIHDAVVCDQFESQFEEGS